MTKRRLRELYEIVRAAAHTAGILACDEGETAELADAQDQIIEECDHASEEGWSNGRWRMVTPISTPSCDTVADC